MKIANKKMGWGEYLKPTPRNIQRWGDGLGAFSMFMTGYAVIMEVKWLAIVFIIFGGLSTFIQKFFSDNE